MQFLIKILKYVMIDICRLSSEVRFQGELTSAQWRCYC